MKPLTKIKYSSIVLDETHYFFIKIKSRIPRKWPVSKNPQHHFLLFFSEQGMKTNNENKSITNTYRWVLICIASLTVVQLNRTHLVQFLTEKYRLKLELHKYNLNKVDPIQGIGSNKSKPARLAFTSFDPSENNKNRKFLTSFYWIYHKRKEHESQDSCRIHVLIIAYINWPQGEQRVWREIGS